VRAGSKRSAPEPGFSRAIEALVVGLIATQVAFGEFERACDETASAMLSRAG
jgi:hypothetical protein